ncbi:hypothetical protein ThvES_00019580, partial [Thiovulum sp. ES]
LESILPKTNTLSALNIYASKYNPRIIVTSPKEYSLIDTDGNLLFNFPFSNTSNHSIAVNQVTEEFLHHNGSNLSLMSNDTSESGFMAFLESNVAPMSFYNTPDEMPPVLHNQPRFIHEVHTYVNSYAPTVIFQLGVLSKGSTQSFTIIADEVSDKVANPEAKLTDTYSIGKWSSWADSEFYKDLNWEVSYDYNEQTRNGTWTLLNTGKGLKTGGTKETNGAMCDIDNAKVYVRFTMPPQDSNSVVHLGLIVTQEELL